MALTWRQFRQFLIDLGAAPSEDRIVTRLSPVDLTFAPGKVAWMHRDRRPALIDRWPAIAAKNPGCAGQWAFVRGKDVEYTTLARHLGVPFGAMTVALRASQTPDDLVQQASIGETLAGFDTPWLPPDRREAFMSGFRMWHMLIQPRFAAAATPAFLYLFSALPGLLKLRGEVIAANLWSPMTEAKRRVAVSIQAGYASARP